MSGVVGLFFRVVLGHKAWVARPLAVATSVSVLALTATPFPPGMYAVLHDRPGYIPGVNTLFPVLAYALHDSRWHASLLCVQW